MIIVKDKEYTEEYYNNFSLDKYSSFLVAGRVKECYSEGKKINIDVFTSEINMKEFITLVRRMILSSFYKWGIHDKIWLCNKCVEFSSEEEDWIIENINALLDFAVNLSKSQYKERRSITND
jgi:hypothetical protein